MKHAAALLLFAALSWFGIGRAEASCSAGLEGGTCSTRPEAYAKITAAVSNFAATVCTPNGWGGATPSYTPGSGQVTGKGTCTGAGVTSENFGPWFWTTECPAGNSWDNATHTCLADCVAGETFSGTARVGASLGSCNASACTVAWTKNGAPYVIVGTDGKPVNYQQWNGITTGGPHCTFAPDTDDDGTADDDDAFPTNPDEFADSDGDGIGDNNDAMPNDPNNGEDTGPGDESDNTSQGGGTCSSPPSSSGDAIAAQIAYQTWATRCATEKTNAIITGNGSSGGTYIGGGGGGTDMTETNEKLDGIKTGTDNLAGEADLDEGSASGTIADIWSNESEPPEFDMGGLGLSRSCPSPPTITLAGMSRTIDTSALCDLSEVIAALVLVMTAAHAAYIFAGRSA